GVLWASAAHPAPDRASASTARRGERRGMANPGRRDEPARPAPPTLPQLSDHPARLVQPIHRTRRAAGRSLPASLEYPSPGRNPPPPNRRTNRLMKPRLFTPGPTPVPEDTLLELAKPVGYHRSPEAKAILAEVTEDLKYVFQTANPVFTLTCSGTGGMEAAVSSTLAAGEKAILLTAGRWGERWRGVLKAFGVHIVAVEVPYGKAVTPEMLADALGKNPETK